MTFDLFADHPLDAPSELISPRVSHDLVQVVWGYWLDHHARLSRSSYALTAKRRKKIREALKLFPLETVKAAIRGVKHSDYHMGRNDRGRRYTNVETILRDAATIERHAEAEMDTSFDCPLEPYPGESAQDYETRKRAWRKDGTGQR